MEIIFKKSVFVEKIETYLFVGYSNYKANDAQFCYFLHEISKLSNFSTWFKEKPGAIMRDDNFNLQWFSKEMLINILCEKMLITNSPELKQLFSNAINTIESIKNEEKINAR